MPQSTTHRNLYHDPVTDVVHLLTDDQATARAGLDAILEQWSDYMQELAAIDAPAVWYRLAYDALDAMRDMVSATVMMTELE